MRGRLARGDVGFGDRAALVFLSFACLASAAGGTLETSASRVPKSAPTLLVSFDGFRASYLDAQAAEALPELTALWRGGVRASLRPRFISKTFPNHYTLVTGLNEQTHGIVANRFFDPEKNESFAPESANARASFWWDGGEPLWVTAVRDARDARVYFWPGSESEIRGVRPSEWRAYEKTESFDARVDAVAAWVRAAATAKKNKNAENATRSATNLSKTKHPFFAVYFEEPDASGHKHGPHAEETKAAVRSVDDAMRRLRLAAGDEAWNEINVIVVSDHGMAELAPSRAVFLADEPCAVPFRDVHVEGSDVVMHVWPRLLGDGDSAKSTPADPADPRAARFDAASLAARVRACHPNVSAWTRDAVPSRFAYGGNTRVGPVVIAADVGWTLCGANASANKSADEAKKSGETGEYAHERDWSAEHSACVASLRAASGHRGAHGFDNDAPEMRAVFIARGPSFRKDGARLSVFREGDGGDGGFEVTALTGRDADASAVAGSAGSESDASVDRDSVDRDAIAAAWEPRTFVFDNTAVFPIAARALGFDLEDGTGGFAALDDGDPFPRVDGVLSASLRDALFDVASASGKIIKRRNAVGADVASFLAAAAASFAAFHLLDRRATGSWPFEKAHALLTLESASDAERQLPETEAGGAARGGGD